MLECYLASLRCILYAFPMNKINNIHDTFFRETMNHQEVVANFLANSRTRNLTVSKSHFCR